MESDAEHHLCPVIKCSLLASASRWDESGVCRQYLVAELRAAGRLTEGILVGLHFTDLPPAAEYMNVIKSQIYFRTRVQRAHGVKQRAELCLRCFSTVRCRHIPTT